MLRIVNIEKTLSQLIYPDISESICFQLKDEFCEWNDQIWDLNIIGRSGKISKSQGNSSDISIDIKGLTQLIAGHRNTTELIEQGYLSGNSEELKKFDKIFPKDWFIVRDFF